jgi:hypothetical protein
MASWVHVAWCLLILVARLKVFAVSIVWDALFSIGGVVYRFVCSVCRVVFCSGVCSRCGTVVRWYGGTVVRWYYGGSCCTLVSSRVGF